ncbi:Flavin carrier 1 [Hyphodiscus hymeniophilus]|uniref:Flavin carrier 1 n=1 Tax=Hyphodiscus hymeniophilus TaxID=353542 RepID=A0A9P6VIQ3_9HELO|nr:Flavin carrier 1 [Hyphodiscus hymeniophilus]
MHLFRPFQAVRILSLCSLLGRVASERVITSTALEECQSNSTFTASLFNIVFTPDNHSLSLNVVGDSSVEGNVILKIEAAAYGYTFLRETINPCTESGLSSLCPLQNLQINFDTNYNNISSNIIGRIPGVAFGIPDLDASITVYMSKADTPNDDLACVRLRLSNGKTVYQAGVGWATAVVAILGLLSSALVSGLGHINTASHIAAYALALFNYFQAIAIVGLCAVPLPSIVQSWTQDFAWSMGIIRVRFLQTLATWYLRGTGGKSDSILETLGTKSVQVLKRGLKHVGKAHALVRRSDAVPTGEYTVRGIKRVAFRAGMEPTNVFLTGIIFFCIFIIFTVLGVTLFKQYIDLAIRARWMKSDRFQSFRDDYLVTLKGIILRTLMIGYPLLSILCLWEFTQVDSPGEVVLAVFIFFGVTATLVWAAFQVMQIARRSQQVYQTPAYMLYTNATTLSKWGFLYIQFRASSYRYIVPTLIYIVVKAMFIAFAQGNGTVQAIALLITEAVALVLASVFRPWMDKPTNAINISICAVNFFNTILLLIFTGIFNGPGLLIGVSGVVFFILNAVFALVLLLVVLVASIFSFLNKNPEARYQPVADNRASFIKSQTALNTELDALGFSARGGLDDNYAEKLGDHRDSSPDLLPPNLGHHQRDSVVSNSSYREQYSQPGTPVTPSMPMLPPPVPRHGDSMSPSRPGSAISASSRAISEKGSRRSERNYPEFRSQNNSSPWQRGAGYDHQ